MKTFVTNKKKSAPAVRKARPYVHHPMGPAQKARQAEIHRILRSTGAQARLTIGQPDDEYEQEADRIADEVMRMPDPKLQRQPEDEEEEEILQTKPLADQIAPLVQRQQELPEEEEQEEIQTKPAELSLQRQPEEEEEEELLQTKSIDTQTTLQVQRQEEPLEEEEEELQAKTNPGETPTVTSCLESRIHAMKGSGQPLPESTRNYFEPRFGQDFSHVRVHTNTQAAKTAQGVNAKAFTLGNNIIFNDGQYSSDNREGKRLLAHELTHVMQQSTGQAQSQNAKKIQPLFGQPPVVQCQRRRTKRRKSKGVHTKDVFDEIKKRFPILAELITPNSLLGGKPPILKGGPVKGGEEHRWLVRINPVPKGSSKTSTEKVTKKKKGQITIVTHEINIDWMTTFFVDPEIKKQAPTLKEARMLSMAIPLLHELIHARIMIEKSPNWIQQHSAIFTGYENIVRIANSPRVAPEKKAILSRLYAMVALITPKPSKAQMQRYIDHFYEFFVHEKYDIQTLYSAVGKRVNNALIAQAYSKTVGRSIKHFGVSLSDKIWKQHFVSPLEREVVALYNTIDGILMGPPPEIIPGPSYGYAGFPGPELEPLITELK